ncbi:zinc finger, CCHC-type containing protein, partial [Tanacetum coccineum]
KNGAENRTKNKLIKGAEKEEAVEAPNSQPVEYYQKHWINEKLIEGLVDNNRFNDSMSGVRVGKIKGNTYNLSPRGPVYEAILRKKITKKEDIGGNFEIPCNVRGLKLMNALVDQGSDVNVIPLSTYMKLTNERPVEIDIRFSLASHSYIYPLGIAEDVLVNVASYVYPVDFVILDIKEDEKRPFILGTLLDKCAIRYEDCRHAASLGSLHAQDDIVRFPKRMIRLNLDYVSPWLGKLAKLAPSGVGGHGADLHVVEKVVPLAIITNNKTSSLLCCLRAYLPAYVAY